MSTTPTPPTSSAARDCVLIVDDDRAARETLAAILSEFYEVELVRDAKEATERLSHRSYQVLITDYQMPGMTGLELLNVVSEAYPNMVAILLTAHSRTREVREADRERKIFAVLTKPCDPEGLIRTTRLAVATSHMRSMNARQSP